MNQPGGHLPSGPASGLLVTFQSPACFILTPLQPRLSGHSLSFVSPWDLPPFSETPMYDSVVTLSYHQQAQSLALSPLAVGCCGDGLLLTTFLINLPWGLHLSCQPYDTSLQSSSLRHPPCLHILCSTTQSYKASSLLQSDH